MHLFTHFLTPVNSPQKPKPNFIAFLCWDDFIPNFENWEGTPPRLGSKQSALTLPKYTRLISSNLEIKVQI